jgi:hypothetical protein
LRKAIGAHTRVFIPGILCSRALGPGRLSGKKSDTLHIPRDEKIRIPMGAYHKNEMDPKNASGSGVYSRGFPRV